MKKATGKTPQIIKKPLSFIVNHNKVTPTKGRGRGQKSIKV
jgi:hypothetical protein